MDIQSEISKLDWKLSTLGIRELLQDPKFIIAQRFREYASIETQSPKAENYIMIANKNLLSIQIKHLPTAWEKVPGMIYYYFVTDEKLGIMYSKDPQNSLVMDALIYFENFIDVLISQALSNHKVDIILIEESIEKTNSMITLAQTTAGTFDISRHFYIPSTQNLVKQILGKDDIDL